MLAVWSLVPLPLRNPACTFSSPVFLMMYSAYKLNKEGDKIQPWHTPFPIWKESVVPCPVLTVVSWPAYRFLKSQVRCSGIPISLRIFQFVVVHTIKGFGIVNKSRSPYFSGTLLLFWWFSGCWLEKEMATHSSVLAWRIPGMAEPWWAAVSGVTQSRTWLKCLSSSSSSRCWQFDLWFLCLF